MNNAKILLVDDDELVRCAVGAIIEALGHDVVTAAGGREALAVVGENFDVIILDINMPDMDGFETLEALNKKKIDIPVLFLTGAGSMEYAIKAINFGAYDFLTKPIDDINYFNIKIKRAIEKRMYVLREKAYRADLEREVKAKTKELADKNKLLRKYSNRLEVSTIQTMNSLLVALEEKDYYTAGHTNRVTEYALMIAQEMKLSEEDMVVLNRAARIHDIGKLIIDTSCINKAGPLSDKEWLVVKKHPAVGENIIKPLEFLKREGFIVRHHHERMDGKGYPDGLRGGQLDILTKILVVADSFDAMTSRRNYRRNLEKAAAIAELRRCADTQFDPVVVEIFVEILENLDGYVFPPKQTDQKE